MSSTSLKSLLSGMVLLAAPVALADSSTSIPAFEASVATATTTTSPGGATVLREELKPALASFMQDSYPTGVDTTERAYLTAKLGDASFTASLATDAQQYFSAFYELNDAATVAAPLSVYPVSGTPESLFGVPGPLADNAVIQEGFIPYKQGVANQLTLGWTFVSAFGPNDHIQFEPINQAELVEVLSGHTVSGTPSAAEVQGAVNYITYISRHSNRLYVSRWACRGCGAPGWTGGYVVAAVSTDRRFVRMVSVMTDSD
jgi:hypothetical protein